MTSTLLLRLVGPMQSWGTQSRFDNRYTGREPSKSGVIGLLCAALGRPRSEPVDDLARLKMGVRVDQEGRLEYDFHTAMHDRFYLINGEQGKKTVISNRFYLADAKFLVGLEGDTEFLHSLYDALWDPHWMLFLGRKAFVPGEPVWLEDGLRDGTSLETTLREYPWLVQEKPKNSPTELRLVLENDSGTLSHNDTPVNFAARQFVQRRVSVSYVPGPGSEEKEG